MRYPNETLVYVYKDSNSRAWLEYTPSVNQEEESHFYGSLGEVLEPFSEYQSDGDVRMSCIIINIHNEEEFLIKNLKYILQPSKEIKTYFWH